MSYRVFHDELPLEEHQELIENFWIIRQHAFDLKYMRVPALFNIAENFDICVVLEKKI